MEGWFKFERKWLENGVINRDSEHLAVWIYLLSQAMFEPRQTVFRGKADMLREGQLIAGRKQIAKACGVQEDKVQRILKRFEQAGLIRQEMSARCRRITLVCSQNENEPAQKLHSSRCGSDAEETAQRSGFCTDDAQQLHKTCTKDAQILHTNKECKNDKNERAKKTRAGAREKRRENQSIFSADASYDLSDFYTRAIGMKN